MTEKIKNLLSFLNAKEYKKLRVDANIGEFGDLAGLENQATTFRKIAEAEKPVIFENDSFGFNRHLSSRISVDMGNITPNYYKVIGTGFDKLIAQIKENIEKATDEDKKNYGKHMLDCIDVCLFIADRYKEFSKDKNQKLYNALCKIPHGAAESFYEACLFMKLSIYCLRLAGVSHLTLGRFD